MTHHFILEITTENDLVHMHTYKPTHAPWSTTIDTLSVNRFHPAQHLEI